MVKKLVLSAVYGVGSAYGALQVALADGSIATNEWSAILGAFFIAAWGKFSNPEKVLSHVASE